MKGYLAIPSCLSTHAYSCEYQPDYVSGCNYVLQDPPGSVLACNRALCPVAASLPWNCVAQFDTVSGVALALRAWGSWAAVFSRWSPITGTIHLPKALPAGFQCVGRGAGNWTQDSLGQAKAPSAFRPGKSRASLREKREKGMCIILPLEFHGRSP